MMVLRLKRNNEQTDAGHVHRNSLAFLKENRTGVGSAAQSQAWERASSPSCLLHSQVTPEAPVLGWTRGWGTERKPAGPGVWPLVSSHGKESQAFSGRKLSRAAYWVLSGTMQTWCWVPKRGLSTRRVAGRRP